MSTNAKWDAVNHYFSGQGVVMSAPKDPVTGLPGKFTVLGNVSSLKISLATSVIDHKGSQDGQRAIDKRLTTEIKGTIEITIQNFISANLASALRGRSTAIPAGSTTGEAVVGYAGGVTALKKVAISALVLTLAAAPLVEYVDTITPFDYQWNADAGSFQLNDGTDGPMPVNLGPVPTAITVGATTVLTVANKAAIGDQVLAYGFTGADAAFINGKTLFVTAASATSLTLALVTTGKVITVAVGSHILSVSQVPTSGDNAGITGITAAYSYAQQFIVDALVLAQQELFMRFEGLNTAEANADGTFSPVIVEVFRFSTDPLKELALISDTFGEFVLDGALLSDPTRPIGTSKFFEVKKLN